MSLLSVASVIQGSEVAISQASPCGVLTPTKYAVSAGSEKGIVSDWI